MVGVSSTMAGVLESLVCKTKTMVAKPETIFRLTRKTVPAFGKIFLFEKIMVAGIWSMVPVKKTMVPTSETMVTATQEMMSFAPTMVCKVLYIGFLVTEQSFANPKLVLFGAPARSHHF